MPEQNHFNISRDEIVNETRWNDTRDVWQQVPPERRFPRLTANERNKGVDYLINDSALRWRHPRT